MFGVGNLSVDGSRVCVRRPISRWTGDVCNCSLAVLRQSKSASSGSFRSSRAFRNKALHVFTTFSALPLGCGNRGLDVVCSKYHFFANSSNSLLANSGPLSVIKTAGIPWRANCTRNWLITDRDVFVCSSATSK